MKYYDTVANTAIKHRCVVDLNFGLATNQFILNQTNNIGLINQIKQLPVYINSRLVTAAGKAFYRSKKYGMHIQLHAALADLEDELTIEFENTFFHEIAHIIAYKCKRHQGHGFPWAYSMMQFGHTPSRTYNPDQFNYAGHKARQVQRLVDDIADSLPDFGLEGLETNAAKEKE